MSILALCRCLVMRGCGWIGLCLVIGSPSIQAGEDDVQATLLSLKGTVEFSRSGTVPERWDEAKTNLSFYVGDRGRTGTNSQVMLRMFDGTIVRFGSETEFRILTPPEDNPSAFSVLLKGLAYFFHLGKPSNARIHSSIASATIGGTEFNIMVDDTGRMEVALLEGAVELQSSEKSLLLEGPAVGIAEAGNRLSRSPLINGVQVIQWCLYYPGILDVGELEWTSEERQRLSGTLEAYEQGDLMEAMRRYAAGSEPMSQAERIYRAALLLSVGEVDKALPILQPMENDSRRPARLARALIRVIAAVQGRQQASDVRLPEMATEWLAASYDQQSKLDLDAALDAARKAVEQSPDFGFGWARVAELEWSFGRHKAALAAVEQSLRLAPRNAQARTVKGFILGSQNRIGAALEAFELAIQTDSSLANAWLGRGLMRFHQRQDRLGLQDLTVAAALEPQRSVLRSYLSKALFGQGEDKEAFEQIDLALEGDAADPRPWLYAALMNQQRHRINEAIHDLERSLALNENRAIERSRLLLDQDRAVGSANLASIYRDANMTEISLYEAGRAVSSDYGNYAAHLFLADSYDQLRDPRRINLRYESAWFSEWLVANLLAPVGVGTLTLNRAQQEYRRLFENNRVGFQAAGEYQSRGTWAQQTALFGRVNRMAYALDTDYRTDNLDRRNSDLETFGLNLQVKQELTAQDAVFLSVGYGEADTGDLTPRYRSDWANPGLSAEETTEPTLLAGYHREWQPGSDTLIMASWIDSTFEVANENQNTLFLGGNFSPTLLEVSTMVVNQEYENDLQLYGIEAQQHWRHGKHGVIVGGRFQQGDFATRNRQNNPSYAATNLNNNALFDVDFDQDIDTEMDRAGLYGYYSWQAAPPLLLVAGLSYDYVRYPENFRYAPVADDQDTEDQISPKGGFIWTPFDQTTIRGAYTRSLGGVSFDQGVQLEPTQVAGFNQLYRSIIPEAVSGANAAPCLETAGLSFEQVFPSRTYFSVAAEWLESEVNREFGVVDYFLFGTPSGTQPGTTTEELDYEEQSLTLTLNQLVGQDWSLGASYRISRACLENHFVDIPDGILTTGNFSQEQEVEGYLHQVRLVAAYQHESGWFALGEGLWTQQSNQGYSPDIPGDDFWQFNLGSGYKFKRNRAALRLSILNLFDQDYRLNPLNLTADLPRERTLAVNLRMNF